MGLERSSSEEFEPAEALRVTNLEVLKVVADVLRSRIVQLLRREPMTVKRLARELDIPPKKLYYHVNLLEEHGLIRVVGTRLVSGIVEKQYRATAYVMMFDDFHATSEEEAGKATDMMLSMVFNQTLAELQHSRRAGIVSTAPNAPLHRQVLNEWALARLTPAEAEELYRRLAGVLVDTPSLARDPEPRDTQVYRLLVSVFPTGQAYAAEDVPHD